MATLHELAAEATKETLDSLGKESTGIKTAGVHEVTIKAAYNTSGTKDGAEWNSITVEFENDAGETARLSEFFAVAKDGTQDAIDKANRTNTRIMNIMTRLAKSAGIPDIKAATSGFQESTDDKGRTITTYPKFKGKKVNIVTNTEISADQKDPSKVYVRQIVDSNKFLDKDGKDGMGRDCIEAYTAEAKTKIEIEYRSQANPAAISKLATLQEQALGVAPQTAQQQLTGMPSATPTASNDDDI